MKKIREVNINTQEHWDKRYEDRESYEKETGLLRFGVALSLIKKGDRVLDIGCGIGTFTALVKNTFPHNRVTGVDISRQAIVDNKKERPDIDYWVHTVGDGVHFDEYDFVFSGEVLEHIDDPSELFKEASAALRKDGTFVVSTPLERNIESPEHIHSFSKHDVYTLFTQNGFTDIMDIKLPMGIDQLVIMMKGTKC